MVPRVKEIVDRTAGKGIIDTGRLPETFVEEIG